MNFTNIGYSDLFFRSKNQQFRKTEFREAPILIRNDLFYYKELNFPKLYAFDTLASIIFSRPSRKSRVSWKIHFYSNPKTSLQRFVMKNSLRIFLLFLKILQKEEGLPLATIHCFEHSFTEISEDFHRFLSWLLN